MKAIYKSLLALTATAPLLTGCIEEVFPTDGVTQEQLEASPKAVDALIWGMPAWMNNYATVSSSQAYDWGYGSIMHLRDVMTEDMAIGASSYNWFTIWSAVDEAMGADYMATQFIWQFLNKEVLVCNKAIAGINPETATPDQLLGLGAAYAFRASTYLDLARMYEFLPCDVFPTLEGTKIGEDGKSETFSLVGYTVPIVTENTTEDEARNNPRRSHNEMYEFIMSDLQKAKEYLEGKPTLSKTLPDMGVTYGLMARLCLWDASYLEEFAENQEEPAPQDGESAARTSAGQYNAAANYARLAITTSGATPMTEEEWLNTSTGFNTMEVSSWMWGIQQMKEDRVVTSGLLNWTSWVSNEAQYGYACAGPLVHIGASVYERINDRDFRKLAFVAPESSHLSGKETFIDPEFAADTFDEYTSLKFRPNLGVTTNHLVGSASAYPLMRVEEMYFIEAEAKAHISPAEGKDLLSNFMKTYRYGTYSTYATSMEDVVDEIIFQKRVELWGEGLTFYDVKRLNMSVTRAYYGTNFASSDLYNTTGRPAWMNIVIVNSEGTNNKAVNGNNNPSPYKAYSLIRL